MVATRETFPLLAELLADQQRLDTPVARLANARASEPDARTLARRAELLPLSAPRPGEQYAFEVDLDACTGCKSCVAACHSLNGLDETETWRDVGLLVGASRRHPFTQTITSACHHCEDPACLHGCPVLAYEKDPLTGIVRHLDDQCIGCSYCILKCPYDAPKFSARLGIVRKCDMCHGRLAAGEPPACAQACPTHAIRIVTVPVSNIRRLDTPVRELPPGEGVPAARPAGAGFLPGAPDAAYTRPTTRYVSQRELPAGLVAGDAAALRPQPPHWPLAIMLTLLPAAVGLSCVAPLLSTAPFAPSWVTRPGEPPLELVTHYVRSAAWATGAAGLAASAWHLGQPRRAWRVFLGWRRSWLSREALLFGLWFALAAAANWASWAAPAAAIAGLAGLACSAMIYVDTRRRFWRAAQTFPRFFGTAAIVAAAAVAPRVAAFLLLAKLTWELIAFCDHSATARLQRGPLRRAVATRELLGLLAALLLVSAPLPLALAAVFAGELAERHLFFRAVDAPKMPGMPA